MILIVCIMFIANIYNLIRAKSYDSPENQTFLKKAHYNKFYKNMRLSDAIKLTPLTLGIQTQLKISTDFVATSSNSLKQQIITFDKNSNRMELTFHNKLLVSKSFVYSIKNEATAAFIKKKISVFKPK